jgi:CBS domain-containing protein
MTMVKQVLDQKGHDVHCIHPHASVFDALKMMAENNIGSLVVLENGKLVGLITERHYAREIVLKGRTSPGTLVRDIMSTKPTCVRPDQSVEECMAVMTAKSRAPSSGDRGWTTSWYSFDWGHGEKCYR